MAQHDYGRLRKLKRLVANLSEENAFYSRKWNRAGLKPSALRSLEGLREFPFTTRRELLADQQSNPPLGTNLTRPLSRFKRFYQSSGTTRAPLLWADTCASWNWVTACSQRLFTVSGIKRHAAVLFVMEFGVRSGPWIILEGARQLGCAILACSPGNLDQCVSWIERFRPTVLVGKPSNLLALGNSMPHRHPGAGVTKLILTGENIDGAARLRPELMACWSAECFDRYGLTEAGSVAAECEAHPGGLHLLASKFVTEVIQPGSDKPVAENEPGELVITTLGRIDRPVVRYRTGDIVRLAPHHRCACGLVSPLLLGGVLGRLPEGGAATIETSKNHENPACHPFVAAGTRLFWR